MKKLTLTVLIVFFTCISMASTVERIKNYSGKNTQGLLSLLGEEGEMLQYATFLLDNCSNNDLAVLTDDYLRTNIEYALKAKEFKYATYDEEIFRYFVLPHRVSQEPLEQWREKFYNELKPIVEEAENIEEAAILVNLWANEQMSYKSTHGRDQGPLTTIKRGYGRCEEMMILYIDAARSVGIPARPASCHYWNFTDSNHAWVEVWTPEGWKYLGEVKNSLNQAWFGNTTKRSTLISSQVFGNYNSKNTIKQENNVTYISTIEYYTDSQNCVITVEDENALPVRNASVQLYAVSFGGLFSMIELFTDENGRISIPLGKGTVWVSAYKDNLFGHKLFNLMEESRLKITLKEDKSLDENLVFRFPLPVSSAEGSEKEEVLGEKFYFLQDISNLKRKDRLAQLKEGIKFVEFYDKAFSDEEKNKEFFEKRKAFLEKCNELAENSSQFLKVLQENEDPVKNRIIVDMIEQWDIKELCEIPGAQAIQAAVDIYEAGKKRFSFPDDIFTENVIAFTWRSRTPPQNGWQQELYLKVKKLAAKKPDRTVEKVLSYLDKQLEIDNNFVFSYFSGSLNPVDILNMKYVPSVYRKRALNSILKILGVPVQWKGRLEYYNGKDFVAVEDVVAEEEKDELVKIGVNIFVDGKQVKAEPFENFLLARLGDDGEIYYTYFDGESDGMAFNAEYRAGEGDNIYIEAVVRNGNGDSNVIIKSIDEMEEITLRLVTPGEYLNNLGAWSDETVEKVTAFVSSFKLNGKKILFIRNRISSEPEVSMLKEIIERADNFSARNADLLIYSENRSNGDLKEFANQFILSDGNSLISENLAEEDYPVIFVVNEQNEIVFSSRGFNLAISDVLLKQID